MIESKKQKYESENYKQWITLPPQIPIPYNQNFLSLLTLQFSNLSYLNTFISRKVNPRQKNNSNEDQNHQSKSDFKIKTYWWGEQHGYQSLLKTLVKNNYEKQTDLHLDQNEKIIKSNSRESNKVRFQGIKFLICCPLENFLKYCFDMKVLKIQFISVETNTILGKTYLNFMSLSNCWKGEASQFLLPLFSPNQSGRPFVNNIKNAKIVGEISLQIKIEEIINPYKIVPQSLSSIKKEKILQNKNKISQQSQRQMKQNDSVSQNIIMKNLKYKQVDYQIKRQCSSKSSSQVQKYLLQKEKNQISISQNEPQYFNTKMKGIQKKQEQIYKFQRNKVKKQISIQDLVPGCQKINIPKHNFQSQKIHLNQDFKIIFGLKNTFYQQIFSQQYNINTNQPINVGNQSINVGNQSHQTIQFKIQLIQSQYINKIEKQIIFQNIKISIPILEALNNKVGGYKMNEYILVQKQGVIKIELETGNLLRKQIENFLKQAQLTVEIKYNELNKKQNQLQSKGGKRIRNQHEKQNCIVFKGNINLLTVLSNSGLPNKLNLQNSNKKYQHICQFYITALPKQFEVKNKVSQIEHKNKVSQTEVNKEVNKTNKITEVYYVWLKVQKFIPINSNYFKSTNIFIKIGLLTKSIKLNQNESKINLIPIAETNTLWKPFQNKKIIATFNNQLITFPVEDKEQQETFLKLQVMNRQEKSIKIGECILDMKGNKVRGRLQLQVRNIKMETIGFLQCWLQQGDLNYINKLTNIHLYKRESKFTRNKQDKKEQSSKQKQKSNKIQQKKQLRDVLSQSQCLYSGSDLQESSNNLQETQNNLQETQNQDVFQSLHKYPNKPQHLINSPLNQFQQIFINEQDILKIHNKLFLQIIVAINTQKIQHNFIQNFKNLHQIINNQNQNINLNLFSQFLASILTSLNQNILQNQKQRQKLLLKVLTQILQKTKTNNSYWVNKLFQFYSSNGKINTYQMNFCQFQNSFEAYMTFYKQIIQEKDHILTQFIDTLNIASIQIKDIQEDFYYELNKKTEPNLITNNKRGPNLITLWKNKIMERILKASRINLDKKNKIETTIERFLSFYQQRILRLSKSQQRIMNNNQIREISSNLVNVICDQLRRFQLYETSYGSQIEEEYFKSYISKSIRDLLQIDYYVTMDQLVKIVQQNQIQLTKWEILNLTQKQNKINMKKQQKDIKERERQRQRERQRERERQRNNMDFQYKQKIYVESNQQVDRQSYNQKVDNKNNQKVIVKSPTFGILQHLHSLNSKPINYNPSFLQNNNKLKPLNISQLSQEKKDYDKSQIFRKQIQTISPINKLNINGNINNKGGSRNKEMIKEIKNREISSSQMNASSLIFSNPHTSSLQDKTKSINQQNQYSNPTQIYQTYNSKDDQLILGFIDMKRKVNWIKIGKNTYFLNQKNHISINKTYPNIQHQLSNYLSKNITHSQHTQNISHSHQPNDIGNSYENNQIGKPYENRNIKDMSSYEVNEREKSQINQNKQQSYQISQNQHQQYNLQPIIIPLEGMQHKTQYNLVIGIQINKYSAQPINISDYQKSLRSQKGENIRQETEEIFINCEHGLDQKIIDQTGTQIGSLIICLLSDINPSHVQKQKSQL